MIGGPLAAALRKAHSPEASDTEINARARARIRCYATRLARFRRASLVSISEINNESPIIRSGLPIDADCFVEGTKSALSHGIDRG